MRKSITLEDVGGKTVSVFEVRPKDVLGWFGDDQSFKDVEKGKQFLGQCCTLSLEEILDLYPSESVRVWEAFQEVNQSLFSLLRSAGAFDEIVGMVKLVAHEFKEQFALRFKLAMIAEPISELPTDVK